MQPQSSMGWAAALLICVAFRPAAEARPDLEIRVQERAVETVTRAIFPLRHEIGIPAMGLAMATVTLRNPRVRIDTAGVHVRTEMTVRSAAAQAVGPATFLFRPRYDARRQGLMFDLVQSRADLNAGGRRLGAVDLSWVSSEMFFPTGQWIDGGNGPVWIDLAPEVRLRPGEIIIYGRLRARQGRAESPGG